MIREDILSLTSEIINKNAPVILNKLGFKEQPENLKFKICESYDDALGMCFAIFKDNDRTELLKAVIILYKIVKGETSDEYIYREQSDRAGYNQPAERIFVHDNNNFGLVFLWIPILLGIIATLFLTYSFFTRDVTDGVDNLTFSPLRALWTGFVTVAIGIPLIFLLFISILGIPVALALAFTLGLAGLAGVSGICLMVGRKVCTAFDLSGISQAKQMLLGILLVAHLVWVPVFGWLVLAIGSVMGLGSIAMIWWPRFKSRWHNWRQSGRQKNAESEQLEKSQCEEKELEKDEDENEIK